MREHLAQPIVLRAELRKRLGKREMLGMVRKYLADQGRTPVEIERLLPKLAPKALPAMELFLDDYAQEGATVLDETMQQSIKGLPGSMRTHLIEAMSHNLDGGARAEAYAAFKWFLVAAGEPLILGDSVCVFEGDGQRPFRPIDDETSRTKAIFLPISSDRVLVGTTDKAPSIDAAVLRDACARCSLEFFVSAEPVTESTLHHSIGSWAGILSVDETRSLLDDVKRELPSSPS
jgi:hypothetical protein